MIKKSLVKTILIMIVVMIAAPIIGSLLLSLAFSIPVDRIWNNVGQSVSLLVKEGDHFSIIPGFNFTDLDNYTDANYLNGALINNDLKGFFTGFFGFRFKNSLVEINYDSPVTVLSTLFNGTTNLELADYGRRFWNGYEIILKPLLLVFNYSQIRVLNIILEICLMGLLIFMLFRRNLGRYSIPLFVSYVFLGPVTIGLSLSFAGFFYCTIIPCILMIKLNDFLRKNKLYLVFFMVVGIITAYFNMNYFQLLTFGYTIIFYYLLNGFPKEIKTSLFSFGIMLVSWAVGFYGMYFLKWVMYEICTGEPIIADMFERTFYRMSATEYYTGPAINRFEGLYKNMVSVVKNFPWLIAEFVMIIFVVIFAIIRKIPRKTPIFSKENVPTFIIFGMMFAVVFARFILFANHVYVHYWATYRIFDCLILLFNVLVVKFLLGEQKEDEKYLSLMRIDHWIKQLFVLPGIVVAFVLLDLTEISGELLLKGALGLLATCFIASSNYVINEWLDAKYDKYHPTKKERVAVTQALNPAIVYILYFGLFTVGIAISIFVSIPFLISIGVLWIMGVLYNVIPRTKDIPYLDVYSESINNAIRFLAGWFIVTNEFYPPISIVLGYWFAGAFLMSMKRFAEFRMINNAETAGLYRKSFKFYSEKQLLILASFNAMLSILFVGIFLVKYRVELIFFMPFLIGLFCYYTYISFKNDSPAQKPEKLYRDIKLMIFIVIICVVFTVLMLVDIPGLDNLLSTEPISIK